MLTAGRVVGAMVLVKAVDVALRGPGLLPAALWAAAVLLWVGAGVAQIAGRRERACWAALLLSGLVLAVDAPVELRRQHLVLLLGIALVGAVTGDTGERLLLWRSQLSVLYGVAALAKLNESFLGGSVLAGTLTVELPLPALLAAGVGLVAVAALLAVTPWVPRLRRTGTAVALLLHGGALALVAGGPLVTLRLVVFGGAAVLLHAVSAGLVRPEPPVRPSARAPASGR